MARCASKCHRRPIRLQQGAWSRVEDQRPQATGAEVLPEVASPVTKACCWPWQILEFCDFPTTGWPRRDLHANSVCRQRRRASKQPCISRRFSSFPGPLNLLLSSHQALLSKVRRSRSHRHYKLRCRASADWEQCNSENAAAGQHKQFRIQSFRSMVPGQARQAEDISISVFNSPCMY